MVPEGFSCVDIGQMHLYNRHLNSCYRITQGDTGVGISSGIDNNSIRAIFSCFMKSIYQITLVVRLEKIYRHIELSRTESEGLVDVIEGMNPIVLWFTFAKQIKVGAVNDPNIHLYLLIQPGS